MGDTVKWQISRLRKSHGHHQELLQHCLCKGLGFPFQRSQCFQQFSSKQTPSDFSTPSKLAYRKWSSWDHLQRRYGSEIAKMNKNYMFSGSVVCVRSLSYNDTYLLTVSLAPITSVTSVSSKSSLISSISKTMS